MHYMKRHDRKIHKNNKNMKNVLSQLSVAVCHAFTHDKSELPRILNFDSSTDEEDVLEKSTVWGSIELDEVLTLNSESSLKLFCT